GSDLPAALDTYQQLRLPRTSAVQKGARANAKTFHRRTMAGKFATFAPMWLAGRLAPTIGSARQDWVYGYDIVREAASGAD
ncbi:MAG: hypothetical protein AAGJ29_09030, partial [Pseudomonadota bacterium]